MATAAENCLIPNCYKVDDIVLEEFVIKDNLPKIRNFQVFGDDTFILSYPRTGTTWTEKILAGILEGPEKGDTLNVEERFPFLEFTQPPADDCPPYDGLQLCTNQERPRFIKSHLPPQVAPNDIGNANIIFIVRNPADTLVSHYHFYKSMTWVNFPAQMSDLFEAWMAGNHVYGGYWNWYRDWAKVFEKLPVKNVHLINYEQLKARPLEEIMRLAKFIGRDISLIEAEEIQKISEFSRMQKTVKIPGIPDFLRSGKVGEGGENLNNSQKARLASAISQLKQQCPGLPLDLY